MYFSLAPPGTEVLTRGVTGLQANSVATVHQLQPCSGVPVAGGGQTGTGSTQEQGGGGDHDLQKIVTPGQLTYNSMTSSDVKLHEGLVGVARLRVQGHQLKEVAGACSMLPTTYHVGGGADEATVGTAHQGLAGSHGYLRVAGYYLERIFALADAYILF